MPVTWLDGIPKAAVRLALIEALLGQSLAAANILWRETLEVGCPCSEKVEDMVDLVTASLAQLEDVRECIRTQRKKRK